MSKKRDKILDRLTEDLLLDSAEERRMESVDDDACSDAYLSDARFLQPPIDPSQQVEL